MVVVVGSSVAQGRTRVRVVTSKRSGVGRDLEDRVVVASDGASSSSDLALGGEKLLVATGVVRRVVLKEILLRKRKTDESGSLGMGEKQVMNDEPLGPP